jgi:hypothetical protein
MYEYIIQQYRLFVKYFLIFGWDGQEAKNPKDKGKVGYNRSHGTDAGTVKAQL